ncbi:MAG: di-heme enzyme [Proteobacteria bacterium]|nr:di-heme enzyme [Pseudomonadota bacterium]
MQPMSCGRSENLDRQVSIQRTLAVPAIFLLSTIRTIAYCGVDENRAIWGKALFFETRLSANGKISCASCHDPQRAFTENKASSSDIEGRPVHRNSPTLINAAHMDVLTWANPLLRKLENQIIVPLFLDTPGEMALIRVWPKVRSEVLAQPPHIGMFRAAFPEEKAPPDTQHLFAALAAFIRTLVAFDSPYDRFLAGDKKAMSEESLKGRDLFFSTRTACGECHSGILLSNASKSEFLKSKDPLSPSPARDGLGQIIQFAHNGLYNWDGNGGVPAKSEGLYEFSGKPEDRGKFRIPSLRNVALTPPYMHDGSIASLEAVIEHYNQGGLNKCKAKRKCKAAPQKHPSIRPLNLNSTEKRSLAAFLRSLTTSTPPRPN